MCLAQLASSWLFRNFTFTCHLSFSWQPCMCNSQSKVTMLAHVRFSTITFHRFLAFQLEDHRGSQNRLWVPLSTSRACANGVTPFQSILVLRVRFCSPATSALVSLNIRNRQQLFSTCSTEIHNKLGICLQLWTSVWLQSKCSALESAPQLHCFHGAMESTSVFPDKV